MARGCKIRCFLVAQCCVIVKETKLRSSDKEASPSVGKTTGVVIELVVQGIIPLLLCTVVGYILDSPCTSFLATVR